MSFSATHTMSTDAVGELPPSVVRPYTKSEHAVVGMDTPTHHARLVRTLGRGMIDMERYVTAGAEHPHMADHFDHLGEETAASNTAWAAHFAGEYGVDAITAMAEAREKVDAVFAEDA